MPERDDFSIQKARYGIIRGIGRYPFSGLSLVSLLGGHLGETRQDIQKVSLCSHCDYSIYVFVSAVFDI